MQIGWDQPADSAAGRADDWLGSPRNRPVSTPAVIAPLTFSAVRAMSMSGSMEISSAATVTGKPMAGSTMNAAMVAPPPTPATPKELMAMIPTSPAMNDGLMGSTPMLGAIITASMA